MFVCFFKCILDLPLHFCPSVVNSNLQGCVNACASFIYIKNPTVTICLQSQWVLRTGDSSLSFAEFASALGKMKSVYGWEILTPTLTKKFNANFFIYPGKSLFFPCMHTDQHVLPFDSAFSLPHLSNICSLCSWDRETPDFWMQLKGHILLLLLLSPAILRLEVE